MNKPKLSGQYIKANNATTTLVFIHGWCCSPKDFVNQVQFFSSRYNIYLPDYSELATASKNEDSNLFFNCVDKIKKEIIELQLENILLVGHSLGGSIALHLAETLHKTRGVVVIEMTIPKTDVVIKKFQSFLAQLAGPEAKKTLFDFIENKLINKDYDSVQLMTSIKNEMSVRYFAEPDYRRKLLSDCFAFDPASAVQKLLCPVLYIGGTPPLGDIEKMKQLNPAIEIALVQSGHFVMLSKPDEFNQLLLKEIHKIFGE